MKRKPGLTPKKVKGRTYWYVRKRVNGGERYIPINEEPGTEAFDTAYWRIISGMDAPVSRTSWGALVKDYRASARFKRLAPSTRRKYDAMLNRFLEKNRDKDIRHATRKGIRAVHTAYADTPAQADRMVVLLRMLLDYARVELEWVDRNVAEKIELFGPQTRTEAWPQEAQKRFVNGCHSLGEPDALTAFLLGVGTGQRAGDLVKMRWAHFDGEFISVVQEKTGARLDVYCPATLRAHLEQLERRGEYILARSLRAPMTYNQIHKRVMRVRKAVGLEGFRIHGWRATAAVELRMAGNDLAAIAAITGHKDLAMVQHYTQDVDQRRLSREAQEKRK